MTPMRFLGIDYGAKRVGLALSDATGHFAAAYAVWPQDRHLITRVAKLCRLEEVQKIILGESRNFKQGPNPIMRQINKFKRALESASGLPIIFEPEHLTSVEAARAGQDEFLDARAAALILQSYLNRQF